MMSMRRPSSNPLLLGVAGLGLTGCFDSDCDKEIAAIPRPSAPDFSNIDTSGPPQIVAAEWIDARVLRLQFSEPIEPPESVDPLRFLVFSADIRAHQYYDDCTIYTRYHMPPAVGADPDEASFPQSLSLDPDDASLLLLSMDRPLRCMDGPGAGLMLVYTNNASQALNGVIRDVALTPMKDLGPSWAVEAVYYASPTDCSVTYEFGSDDSVWPCFQFDAKHPGSFPDVDHLLPIPCPA